MESSTIVNKLASLTCVWALALSAMACDDEVAGRVELAFAFDTPPETSVWVWARVEGFEGVLATAGPARLDPGGSLALDLAEIPEGKWRLAIIEAREEDNTGLPVLYYGVSEPFETGAGKTVTVDVPVALQVPEGDRVPPTVQVRFDGQSRTSISAADAARATVRIRASGAVRVLLANDPSFFSNLTTLPFAPGDRVTCEPDETDDDGVVWRTCEIASWDMLAGLPSGLPDGLYSVFIRLVDANGYAGGVHRASALLDTQPPVVTRASLEAAVLRWGTAGRLTMSVSEELAPDASFVTPVGGPVDRMDLPFPLVRVPNTLSHDVFFLVNDTPHGSRFTFEATLTDAAGNTATVPLPLADVSGTPITLNIDNEEPVLVPGSVSLVEAGANLQGGRIAFSASLEDDNWFDPAVTEPIPGAGHPALWVDGRFVDWNTSLEFEGQRIHATFDIPIAAGEWGPIQKDMTLAIWVRDAAADPEGPILINVGQAVRFDFVAPAAVTCRLTPDPITSGSQPTLEVVADEPLDGPPTIAPGADVFTLSASSATSFTWTSDGADFAAWAPQRTLAVSFVDLAGNPGSCSVTATIEEPPP